MSVMLGMGPCKKRKKIHNGVIVRFKSLNISQLFSRHILVIIFEGFFNVLACS